MRKSANRILVTAQLVEAETDKHVWAERYDRRRQANANEARQPRAKVVPTLTIVVELTPMRQRTLTTSL